MSANDNDYHARRKRAIREFERNWLEYISGLGLSVSEVSRRESLDRVYLHKLLRRHGVAWPEGSKGRGGRPKSVLEPVEADA
jgi:hypothetical protein